ncbi:MAG: hypothetical protein A2X80_14000 [Geobacteraceae bacterium GWB2_52_12]|nr:MAG: hypothetical protein A2X80_14000 [Geobacteraceae bacterium GWB2_52_12]
MAIFEWDDSISIGIATIDEQHKALFGWINSLSDEISKGDGFEATGDVIRKLITYVTEHFSDEERLMLSCNYPDLVAHRKEHDLFVDQLQKIQVRYFNEHEMSRSVLDFMVEWLVCHIKGTDQAYSRFINQQ